MFQRPVSFKIIIIWTLCLLGLNFVYHHSHYFLLSALFTKFLAFKGKMYLQLFFLSLRNRWYLRETRKVIVTKEQAYPWLYQWSVKTLMMCCLLWQLNCLRPDIAKRVIFSRLMEHIFVIRLKRCVGLLAFVTTNRLDVWFLLAIC